MRSDCFLDTNILIYAAAGRQDDPRKFQIAEQIISTERFGLSGQVLAEFYVNIFKKPQIAPSRTEVDEWIDLLCEFPIAAIDATLVRMGILYSQRFQINYFDAAIIAAAVMTEFDGKPIQNLYDFTYALRAKKAGQEVLVKVLRGTETIEAKVLLTARK